MLELTVGQVAGLIAFGIYLVRITFPTIVVFLLGGLLRDKETAATWTVAGRALQVSYWPLLLRSDAVRHRGVRATVRFGVLGLQFAAILVAVTGVITPLGLFDILEPSGNQAVPFQYVRDTSSFALATHLRSDFPFSRICSSGHGIGQGPAPCPYSNTEVIFSSNGTYDTWYLPYNYSTRVPEIVTEIYSSGTRGVHTTVSNYFDIQWRQWSTKSDEKKDNGTLYLVASYRQIENVVLKDRAFAVEGLVVDAQNGSLGFRNHTLPKGLQYGASWSEDLLFIGPETVCVDMNLTLDFTVNKNPGLFDSPYSEVYLTDRGGFVHLNQTNPYVDYANAQADPDLWGRAYKAAWLHNAYSMAYLNVTNPQNSTLGFTKAFSYMNSNVGKQFPLPPPTTRLFEGLRLNFQYGSYLLDSSFADKGMRYSNPFGIGSEEFDTIPKLCSGSNTELANITSIYAICGLMQAVPYKIDGGLGYQAGGESRWSAPLYSCASTIKADIRTVSFLLNGTASTIEDLVVTEIRGKEYQDNDTMPLWGVEDPGMTRDGISLVWGLVSPEYKTFPNMSVVQKPALFLPGTTSITVGMLALRGSNQYMPGSDFAVHSMNSAFQPDTLPSNPVADYSGAKDMAMFLRWQNLSSNDVDASSIINLIWTDIAAQGVVGTKGTLGPGNTNSEMEGTTFVVHPIRRNIRYHWPYGVPAIVLLSLFVVVGMISLISALIGNTSLLILQKRLNQTSTGRIVTSYRYPSQSDMTMLSADWSKTMGSMQLDMSAPLTHPECQSADDSGT